MATVRIQHSCGHDRAIETPGPEDPEGLLQRHAQYDALHRSPVPCPDCQGVDLGLVAAAVGATADSGDGLPSGADLDAVLAEKEIVAHTEGGISGLGANTVTADPTTSLMQQIAGWIGL